LTVWQGASFYFSEPYHRYKIPRETPSAGALNVQGGKIRQILPFISKMLSARNFTTEHK